MHTHFLAKLASALFFFLITVMPSRAAAYGEELVETLAAMQAQRVEYILRQQIGESLAEESYFQAFLPKLSAALDSQRYSFLQNGAEKVLKPLYDDDLLLLKNVVICLDDSLKKVDFDKNSGQLVWQDFAIVMDAFLRFGSLRADPAVDNKLLSSKTFFDHYCKSTGLRSVKQKIEAIQLGAGDQVSKENAKKWPFYFAMRDLVAVKDASDYGRLYVELRASIKANNLCQGGKGCNQKEKVAIGLALLSALDKQLDKSNSIFSASNIPVLGANALVQDRAADYLEDGRYTSFVKLAISFKAVIDTLRKEPEGKQQAAIYVLLQIADALGLDYDDYRIFTRLAATLRFLAALDDADDDSAKQRAVIADALASLLNGEEAYRAKKAETGAIVYRSNEIDRVEWKGRTERTLFLNSYAGVAWSDIERSDADRDQWRVYVPFGLEWKFMSLHARPVTLGVAPIDIGAYVTNEFRDDKVDAELSDIRAPSAYVSFSLSKSKPVSLLLGYQRNIPLSNGKEESAVFVSVAFDTPWLTLY